MPDEDQWKEDILKLADNFAEEGRELINFACKLREAVIKLDQDTCWAFVAAILERLIERKANVGREAIDSGAACPE